MLWSRTAVIRRRFQALQRPQLGDRRHKRCRILKPAEKKKPNGSRPVTPPRNMVTKQAKK